MLLTSRGESAGDLDGIDAAYRAEIAANPRDAWARGNHADFLLHGGGTPEAAIRSAEEALAIFDDGVGRRILAQAHVARGNALLWDSRHEDANGALGEYELALKTLPTWDAHYGRAAALRSRALHDHQPKLVPAIQTDLDRALALVKAQDAEDVGRLRLEHETAIVTAARTDLPAVEQRATKK